MIVEALFSYVYDRKFIYQSIATLVTFAAIQTISFVRTRKRRYHLFKEYNIPGPEPNLLDGNLRESKHETGANFLVDTLWRKKYGKFYGFFIGDEPCIGTTDLDILKKVFLEENESFRERCSIFMETAIINSVLFAEHKKWKLFRKIMSAPFGRYTVRGDTSTQFIENTLQLMLDYIERKQVEAKSTGGKAEIDIHDLMKSTALYLISNMAFKLPNVQVKEKEENVTHLDYYLSLSDKGLIVLAIMFPFFKRILEQLARYSNRNATLALIYRGLDRTIDEHLNELSNKTELGSKDTSNEQLKVMHSLIKLHHEGKLSRDEVLGNAEAILIAGYDTTSTTLTYIFWVLAKHSEVQERLRIELMAHGIESKYLEQVIKETMRLYPTVFTFTTRLATKTVQIGDLTIPQGAKVIHNNWLMSRDESIWTEPEKFDPERFKEGADIHPCAYAPFGLGDRRCLGYQLAMLEMKMITCDILLRYRLRLKSPENLELVTYAVVLSKPREKVMIELEKL